MESVPRIIDRIPPEDLSGLRESSEAYDAIKVKMAELPPAPRSEFREGTGSPPRTSNHLRGKPTKLAAYSLPALLRACRLASFSSHGFRLK
jgi:hypothetical protein